MRDEAVGRLKQLIARYETAGDASLLHAPHVQEDVDAALEAMAAPGGATSDAACTLGVFLCHRGETSRPQNMADLILVIEIFSQIPERADVLPRPARNSIAHLWNDQAAELFHTADGSARSLLDLDEAVRLFRNSVLMLGQGHPMATIVTARAGAALLARFRIAGEPADLDEAIVDLRSPLDDPQVEDEETRAVCSTNLGRALRLRFCLRGDPADLGEALLHFRDGHRAGPADELIHAAALWLHWAGADDPVLALVRDRMVPTDWNAVTEARPPGWHCSWPAQEALRHARTTEDLTVLDHALSLLRRAAGACPPGSADHLAALREVEAALLARLSLTGDDADTEALAAVARLSVELVAARPDLLAGQLAYLTQTLRTCWRRSGRVTYLNEAIERLGCGGDRLAPRDPARYVLHANLGAVYQDRHEANGNDSDAAAAEAAMLSALVLLPPGHPERPLVEEGLVRLALVRGAPDSLDAALVLQRARVRDYTGADSSAGDRIMLIELLSARAHLSGTPARWEETITEIEGLISSDDVRGEELSVLVSSLSIYEWNLYQLTGDPTRLDRSVARAEAALDALPHDAPDRATLASNLCNLLAERAYATGSAHDVHAAVAYGREAFALAAGPGLDMVANLARALSQRFRFHGDLDDLDEAISLGRLTDARTVGVGDSPYWHAARGNLALHLTLRHAETGDAEDLSQAIEVGRSLIGDARVPAARNAAYHSNHVAALLTHSRAHPNLADLDEAVATARKALALAGPLAPDRATYLSHLAGALAERHFFRPCADDLDEAVDHARSAVAAAPDHHSDLPRLLHTLATLLVRRDGRSGDAREATALWRRAASLPAAPAVRLRVTLDWGAEAASFGDWGQALEAYTLAIGLLPELSWIGIGQNDRQRLLSKATGLASDAAACALSAGHPPERAIAILEQARAVVFTGEWQWSAEATALRAVDPDLADRLTALRAQLGRQPEARALDAALNGALPLVDGARPHPDAMMALGRRWDEAVAEARALPGFSAFLRDPPAPVLELPRGSAAVVVNVSRYRCDALLITGHDVHALRLRITAMEIAEMSVGHLRAQFQYERRTPSGADSPAAALVREHAIGETLGQLWRGIAEPVLNALGHVGPPATDQPWPRVWWCPTNMLTHLPLHAAGEHDLDGPGHNSVMDRVISSYAPTLRALSTALTPVSGPVTEPSLLSVAPEPPGHRTLPGAARDAQLLSTFAPRTRLTRLHGAQATVRAVTEALAHHTWVHFSCHGDQNITDPSSGGLILQDGRLTVADVVRARHPANNLAFLAACKSASGGVTVPDEVLTPAAAFHHAGFRHVVGTLWAVDDAAASDLTEQMYTGLLVDGRPDATHAAAALHQAVRHMRTASPYRPGAWAAFVHLGA
ncbi:CHAT domain-containing protein [Streptomyces sp. NPDC012693]|uniref:CHAT domain-containing protein n=1 Tax=Streptomyces sp. NPDC012693 TaxID=3364844 RepID=UPI0036CC883B